MKIKWLGHACFLITSDNGARILTDPFDHTVGYEVPAVEANIVTTSHEHFDHNHTSVVKGDFTVFKEAGSFSKDGISITGVSTYHDTDEGAKRGKNVVYKFNVDGVDVCHCGDLGHILNEKQASELGKVDVLLVPVGGTYTLDAAGAAELVKLLKPAVTIPMHFKTEVLGFPIDGVDKFLKAAGEGQKAGQQEIEITVGNLSMLPKVLVLDYK